LAGLKKAPRKVAQGKISPKAPSAIRTSNHVHKRKVFLAICIILVAILGTIFVNSVSSNIIANAYSITGVGVGIYWDQGCTNRTLSLNWGPTEPGSNNTVTVYVRNEGQSPVSLWMAMSNWTPSGALGNMTLTWTYTGRILSASEVIPIDLTLNASPTISGITDFRFDIVITATG